MTTPTMNGLSIEEIVASYDQSAPLAEASTIPAPWYVDARIAELERQTVFSHTWQVMGRVDQVEKPGQFVTATVAGEPLVAVRGQDGVVTGLLQRMPTPRRCRGHREVRHCLHSSLPISRLELWIRWRVERDAGIRRREEL
jgi:Phenylpropionate dioxygenase and related ring-hydroxylating dioxygenases, large terminal subunit